MGRKGGKGRWEGRGGVRKGLVLGAIYSPAVRQPSGPVVLLTNVFTAFPRELIKVFGCERTTAEVKHQQSARKKGHLNVTTPINLITDGNASALHMASCRTREAYAHAIIHRCRHSVQGSRILCTEFLFAHRFSHISSRTHELPSTQRFGHGKSISENVA